MLPAPCKAPGPGQDVRRHLVRSRKTCCAPRQGRRSSLCPFWFRSYPPAKELTPAQAEIAKGLFESATDEQKDVLKLMGVEQPTQPTPDLTELCRQHIDALPESIKMLLEKQSEPEKAPTVTETSRKFKVATADLRELILKKALFN